MLFKTRVRLDISSWRGGKGADLHAFQDPSSARYLKLARGKGSRSSCFSRSEFGSISQAGEGEREQIFMLFKIRVRLDISSWRGGKGADLHAFQDPSSARYLKLARGKGSRSSCFSRSEFGSTSQAGEGEREQIFMLFKTRVRLDISSWRGEREQIFMLFKIRVRLDISSWRGEREPIIMLFNAGVRLKTFRSAYLEHPPRSVPSPFGRGLG
ncbi:hypothetical protein [Pseudomonas sp. S2_E02]